jgi:hypothetical protein
MLIEKKNIADLIPADYNPRTISDAAMKGLTASIERFGLVEPVVWNKRTGHVVGGHQRLKVLQAKGMTETEVIVVDLDETEERALNVTLNNPNIAGQFTGDLQIVLEDLKIELGEGFGELRLDELQDGTELKTEMNFEKEERRKSVTLTINAEEYDEFIAGLKTYCNDFESVTYYL